MSQIETAEMGSRTKQTRSTRARTGGRGRGRSRRLAESAGAAGFGRLASEHDRATARRLNAAERMRVEAALAAVPLPSDRRRVRWQGAGLDGRPGASGVRAASALRALSGGVETCPVCTSGEVRSDETRGRGASIRLSECGRCDHRWTEAVASRAGSRMRAI